MRRGSIIKNPKVLTAEYLPNKMHHRQGEREEIARNIEPLLTEEGLPQDMLLHGPPGVGKTAMTDYVVNELKENMFLEEMYVNCFSHKSRFEILYELLDKKLSVPRDGTSTEKVKDELDKKVRNKPCVFIIDEVDQLSNEEVLYDLSRYTEAPVIYVANDPQVFGHFDDRIQSRMTSIQKLHFKRYSKDELVDILDARASHGLQEDTIEKGLLREIAGKASGDARKALNTLRLAAQTAEKEGKEHIPERIVEDSLESAKEKQRLKSLEMLNEDQKIVYKILQDEGEAMNMSQLYQKYSKEKDNEKSRRTIRRYLTKMDAYNVVEKQGKKSSTEYRL